ncbi:MAG: bacteriohopanetetrol glucosamine biosynthesis glycosyltransferase HpnI [Xanthobacteraceae bacterium]|jgi:ceramide glucosyltransferase
MSGTWQTMIQDALWLVFFAGAMLGCLFMTVAVMLVSSFARSWQAAGGPEPAVTVLVPLHGNEPGLFDNLAAFCDQDYSGEVQIIFGVADPHDPAIRVVRCLQLAFPGRQIELLVNAHAAGSNPKVSNLIGMSSRIQHETIVIVDSDIRVGSHHLRRVVSALERFGGAVTCPYFGISTGSVWSRLARLGIDSHFLPGIMVGVRFKLARPCLGSTIALSRNSFAAIGGFEAVANCLADDHALGEALRKRGETVSMLPLAVGHICSEDSWRELWLHEVRWALTIRNIDPVGYAGWGLSHAFPLALAALCLGGGVPALALAAAAIACRIALVLAVERGYGLPPHPYWLIPARDLLSFAVFIAGFTGRAINWKGRRFRVLSEYGPILERGSPLP